jgi:hypothetical protein
MRGLLKKLLFGDVPLKTFYSIRCTAGDIKETVLLKTGTEEIDVTLTHSVVCLEPMQVGIFLPANMTIDAGNKYYLEIKIGHALRSKIELKFTESISLDNSYLHIFQAASATSYQLSSVKQNLLLNVFLKNQSTSNMLERKKMAALYAHPKKVILVSVKDGGYFNIFPMDLQCYLPGPGLQILGLRTSNIALDKILQLKKLVVADTQRVDTDVVLELGKHHTTAPTVLPFKTIESAIFGFPLPGTTACYKEIEIVFHKNIGSHTMMIGKTINTHRLQTEAADLYHLHVFEYLESGYKL